MAIESTEVQLERVQKAIKIIEEGSQDYTINGRTVTRADLATLYKREAELKRQLVDETYGTRTIVGWYG